MPLFKNLSGAITLAACTLFATSATVHALSVVPKEAASINVGVGALGVGGVSFDLRGEVPPYGDLKLLSFIPGFGMDVMVGYDGGLLVQNALCVRFMPVDRLVAKAGMGLGIALGAETPYYVPVVAAGKYFLTDKLNVEGHLSVPTNAPGATRISVSAGFGFGYFKKSAAEVDE